MIWCPPMTLVPSRAISRAMKVKDVDSRADDEPDRDAQPEMLRRAPPAAAPSDREAAVPRIEVGVGPSHQEEAHQTMRDARPQPTAPSLGSPKCPKMSA